MCLVLKSKSFYLKKTQITSQAHLLMIPSHAEFCPNSGCLLILFLAGYHSEGACLQKALLMAIKVTRIRNHSPLSVSQCPLSRVSNHSPLSRCPPSIVKSRVRNHSPLSQCPPSIVKSRVRNHSPL